MMDPILSADDSNSGVPVFELSSWGLRAAAEIIDVILISVIAVALIGLLGLDMDEESTESDYAVFIFGGVYLVMMSGVMGLSNGKTVGMMATNIRVVREDGLGIGLGYALYRQFLIRGIVLGLIATFTLGVAYLLNYLWPIWDDKNQALHDKVCKTRVVRDRTSQSVGAVLAAPAPTANRPPAPAAPGTYQSPPGFENPVPED